MSSTISFFITDVVYKKNNSSFLEVLGRTEKGKKVILEAEFKPYFWLDFKNKSKLETKLKELEIEVKYEKKEIDGKKKELMKLIFNSPEELKEKREKIKKFPEAKDIREYDIPYEIRFLIDNKLKQFHLCNAEVSGKKIKSISCTGKRYSPKILAYDIETSFKTVFPTPEKEKILFISFYGSEDFKKVITWKKFKTKNKTISFVSSEKELIEEAEKTIKQFDPDIVLGYNSDQFDFPFLQKRAEKNHTSFDLNWIPHNGNKTAGISMLDALVSVRKIIGQNLRTNKYTLDAVSEEILGEKKKESNIKQINEIWKNGKSKDLDELAEYNLIDSVLAYKLLKNMLLSLFEINDLTNIFLEDSSKMNYGMLVEWFLINNFYNNGKIIPNRPSYKNSRDRQKQKFQGAYVFQPQAGLYENLHVLDFRSLYPSIIIAHNISPENSNFLPTLLKKIVHERRKIKSQLSKKYSSELNARQFSLKILANSFYGYYGFPQSRWYSLDAAKKVTEYGRKYIKDVIEKAEKSGFKVIYSDTDSVFLKDSKSKKKAKEFAKKINESLPEEMELEYEDFYLTGLFISRRNEAGGAKKRYALLDENQKMTIKGLEAIRGDWSNLAKKIQKKILRKILVEKNADSALKYFKEIVKKIRNREIDLQDLVIKSRLSKSLENYKSRGPHIAAAQILKNRGEKIKKGQSVEYIVCKGPEKNISDRIKLPEDAKLEDYDPEYYINHQIIRSVFKIFDIFDIKLEEISSQQSSLSKWK